MRDYFNAGTFVFALREATETRNASLRERRLQNSGSYFTGRATRMPVSLPYR
jgi:hypothetical protein